MHPRATEASNRKTTLTGLSWNVPKERLAVALQIECRVSLERFLREPNLAHVREAPQPRLVAPVGSADQKRSVARRADRMVGRDWRLLRPVDCAK